MIDRGENLRLTTMSRYGARAVFDIAYHSLGLPVQIKDICERQEIPQRYLAEALVILLPKHSKELLECPSLYES